MPIVFADVGMVDLTHSGVFNVMMFSVIVLWPRVLPSPPLQTVWSSPPLLQRVLSVMTPSRLVLWTLLGFTPLLPPVLW